MRILLVEDNVTARHYMARALREANHDVVEAGSIEEAQAELARQPADVLVTDMGLPDGTGIELGVAARQNFAQLHIAVCSGLPPSFDEEMPVDFHYLSKPFSMGRLVELVNSLGDH
jgi:DNA-binding response OmpR family regulator